MLDDNSVGNTRNTVTFVKAYFGKKRSCWYKKDPLPFSGYDLRKDIGGKDYSRTAAAASSCVSVLRRIIIDQDTAVFMNGRKPDILFLQKIQENFLSDDPQITSKDGIIIRSVRPKSEKLRAMVSQAAGAIQPPMFMGSLRP